MSKELVFNGIKDTFSELLGKKNLWIRKKRKDVEVLTFFYIYLYFIYLHIHIYMVNDSQFCSILKALKDVSYVAIYNNEIELHSTVDSTKHHQYIMLYNHYKLREITASGWILTPDQTHMHTNLYPHRALHIHIHLNVYQGILTCLSFCTQLWFTCAHNYILVYAHKYVSIQNTHTHVTFGICMGLIYRPSTTILCKKKKEKNAPNQNMLKIMYPPKFSSTEL